jgi:rifampicin phosphotransferase
MFFISMHSTQNYAKSQSGGKGYNLYVMSHAGFQVPNWFVIPADTFEKFKEQNNFEQNISEIIKQHIFPSENFTPKPQNFEDCAKVIEKLIATGINSLEKFILSEYEKLKQFENDLVAVRSSALDEDSAQHSFAGQLSSYLYVDNGPDVLRYVKECWASAFSARCLSYRFQNKLELTGKTKVAVVIQKMISSEKSGVLFTCDPISKSRDVLTINAVFGVGEGLVSGTLEGDAYYVNKQNYNIEKKNVAEKKSQFLKSKSGETHEVPLPEGLYNAEVLLEAELRMLWELGCKVEQHYGFPQDIEWAFEGGQLYLLQSRPITTEIFGFSGKLNIWDNSNIIESYGGLTLPLTFTFARFVYHSVYVQMCEVLMVPKKEILKMDFFLKNMLGIIHGRVYYNILNWYKLTSILPGFKYNRGFMETMMGTQYSLADEIADRIKPSDNSVRAKMIRFFAGIKFLYFHFSAQSMVDNFLNYFHSVYEKYRGLNYEKMNSHQILHTFENLEVEMLANWKAPIINDYLCMVHFGLYKKLTSKWLSHCGDSLQNDLLCGEGNLESAEPTRELIRMAKVVSLSIVLKQIFENNQAGVVREALRQSNSNSEVAEFEKRVDRYIHLYGHRCMSEMKLEQPDLHQDPTFLFTCLKNYLRSGSVDLQTYEHREKTLRSNAEKLARKNVSGFKKLIYFWSLKNARMALRNRENTRFCRTRIYGIVRSMFFSLGRNFTQDGALNKPEDIFYLELQELKGSLDGYLTVEDIRKMVNLRKESYEEYATQETPPRISTRGPVYWNNQLVEEEEIVELKDGQIGGTGCCPGIVEGIVKIILEPSDNMELNGEILVTLRTDPGWIPLYPSLSGLLVERGGLLSHSAIVAREMGLPAIVGIKGLTQHLKSGMKIRMDGKAGTIEILNGEGSV